MRAAVLALVATSGLMTVPMPAGAAPLAPHDLALATTAPAVQPDVHMVRGGCGPGWHPRRWIDRWGRWQVRCVPNRW